MVFENLLLSREEGIAVITINRPKSLNALNKATLAELSQALDSVDMDREVKAVILTGAGEKSFVAGGDIPYMQDMDSMRAREFVLFGQKVLRKLEYLPKPVIAAINGFCLGGGCELALACDFRIASQKAKFGQPEVKLGVIPGLGGTQRLPRMVGTGMAKQLLYTGDIISAQEALRIGLINEVVPANELISHVLGIASRIISGGLLAVSLCKFAVNEGLQTDMDRAMTIEADIFGLSFSTFDQKEGMKAFAEKRAPHFHGE
ncbi:MAG TPA: enoyl-CoA hydratase-related protein [Syntrophomonadaceae bacterium]|nr:enoyl-CoA hydratase-related protein [Syntrophomonadaceae bacterium]